MGTPNKPSEQTQSSFKVDHDASGINEMPSVTRLLNRKKLGLGAPAAATPPSPPVLPDPVGPILEVAHSNLPSLEPAMQLGSIQLEPAQAEPSVKLAPPSSGGLEISLSDGPTSVQIESSGGNAPASIQTAPSIATVPTASLELSLMPSLPAELNVPLAPTPSTEPAPAPSAVRANTRAAPRRPAAATPNLAVWDAAALMSGSDPLGKGLLELTKQGVPSAVFLSIQNAAGKVVFGATAAYAPGPRQNAWAGIRLNPEHFPELWGKLLKDGFAEFAPPGTGTDVGSLRNLVRGAFATRATEWLTFFRAGTPASCRGILVVVSSTSLRAASASALRHIATPVALKKAA